VPAIDPEEPFGGDRLLRCSNAAWGRWPQLFLAFDGLARLETSYAKTSGRSHPSKGQGQP
jgi:hypothetical protein